MPVVFNIMLPIFALIIIGFAARRSGFISPEAASGLARLVYGIGIPALLFRSLAEQDLRGQVDLRISLIYFGACFLILATALLLGRRVLGLDLAQSGLFGLSAMYSNSSLLGIPIIQAAFGTSGLVLLGKIIAFHSLLLLPAATVIISIGQHDGARLPAALGHSLRSTAANPIVLGLLAGVAWSLTGRPLWAPVERVTSMLAETATPMALLALGAMQANSGCRALRGAGASVAFKLLLHPGLVYLLALAIGGLSPQAIAVATITAALPAGVNVYLLAQQHDCYVAEATAATSLGTLLSMASLTAIIQLSLRFA